MNIGVVGSRSFDDDDAYYQMKQVLDGFVDFDDAIISGGAKGADTLARRYAEECGLKLVEHLPQPPLPAGYFERNTLIVEDSQHLFAFFGPEGTTPGTLDTVIKAVKRGVPVQTNYHWRWEGASDG